MSETTEEPIMTYEPETPEKFEVLSETNHDSEMNITLIAVHGVLIVILVVGLILTWVGVKKLRNLSGSRQNPGLIEEGEEQRERSSMIKNNGVLGVVSRNDPYYEYVPGFNEQKVEEEAHYYEVKIEYQKKKEGAYDHLIFPQK